MTEKKDRLPLVTISMPVFNGASSISNALDSIVAQTYPNLEIIVSDNASDDETFDICQRYEKKDPRIVLQRQDSNVGVYANSRSIWKRARGRYILFSGCDDTWKPNFIEKLVAALENNPHAALAACRAEYYSERDEFLDAKPLENLEKPTIFQAIKRLYHLLYIGEEPKNYNRYILGLFNLDLVKKFMADYPDLPGDTAFLSAFACDYGFIFVDEPLMKKIKNDKPFRERYKDDPYSISHRKAIETPLGRIKMDIERFAYLFSSSFISTRSKVFVLPPVCIVVFWGLGMSFIWKLIGRFLAAFKR
ncbi:MAG TPA: glycosyltransferase [Alphaproteobacteria bacterium]|nr:glycosyltransferase [Alphaproteobacteria bacterium]HOO49722.1 glycosyltransferase [Alphaproteobacteria bacterium]